MLDELPPGRMPVQTVIRGPKHRDDIYKFVHQQITEGRQAYIVYPLVAESEKVDLLAATDEYERLSRDIFPNHCVGLIHGQLSGTEKDAVMRAFLDGETDVLVATTVIEVGIDVGNATVMVIEHPERFGLSQLHQLRGRVGRGGTESHCILVAELVDEVSERLRVLTETTDGFEVARADLRIRGQGDLFGKQQHGRDPILRFADIIVDEELLAEAQKEARALIASDPELTSAEHQIVHAQLQGRYRDRLEMYAVG